MTEQNKVLNPNVAIVENFLKNLGKKNDEGTQFYSDVTILYGPGQIEHDYIQKEHKDLFKSWVKGEVSMFNVKCAGVSFIIEYTLNAGKGIRPALTPCQAFMVYKHQMSPVSLNIALAAKDLYREQRYTR